jgi:hypothetical protein
MDWMAGEEERRDREKNALERCCEEMSEGEAVVVGKVSAGKGILGVAERR